MACRPNRWLYGLPFLALLGGYAYFNKRDFIEADLMKRASTFANAGAGAQVAGKPWANYAVQGRDVSISGASGSAADASTVSGRAQSTHGVRLVDSANSLIAEAKPFKWSIAKTAAGIALGGHVGIADERGKINSAITAALPAAKITDNMTVARGTPACALVGAAAAATQVAKLDTAEVSLEDCKFNIKGHAPSIDIKNGVETALKALTGGLTLGSVAITAPVPPPPPPPAPVVIPAPAPLPPVAVPVPAPPPPPPAPVAPPPPPAPVVNHVAACQALINTARANDWPHFNVNKWNIDAAGSAVITKVGAAIKNCHTSVKFEISGHADSRADAKYNEWLSTNRVNAVKASLVKLGTDAARITTLAKGEDTPAAPNTSEENMRKNRRVEINAR